MATTNPSSKTFDMMQKVRRNNAALIRRMNGVHFERLEVHNNLEGDWEGADHDKVYCGIVPVIGGQPRYDLSWLSFDLQLEDVAAFNQGPKGDVSWLKINDELHKFAVQQLVNAPTYDAWFNAIVAHFPNGGTLVTYDYSAKTKKDGIWLNSILGANL